MWNIESSCFCRSASSSTTGSPKTRTVSIASAARPPIESPTQPEILGTLGAAEAIPSWFASMSQLEKLEVSSTGNNNGSETGAGLTAAVGAGVAVTATGSTTGVGTEGAGSTGTTASFSGAGASLLFELRPPPMKVPSISARERQ